MSVSAARLLSAVAPLPWLLFTYYRRVVMRRNQPEKQKQAGLLFVGRRARLNAALSHTESVVVYGSVEDAERRVVIYTTRL